MSSRDKKVLTVCYAACWVYIAFIILPKLMIPLRYILGETAINFIYDHFVNIGEHTIFPYFVFSLLFAVFMIFYGYHLRKVGIERTALIIVSNAILPWIAGRIQGNIIGGIILLIVAVLVFALTLITANKLIVTEHPKREVFKPKKKRMQD